MIILYPVSSRNDLASFLGGPCVLRRLATREIRSRHRPSSQGLTLVSRKPTEVDRSLH